jgi:hypothetical protein
VGAVISRRRIAAESIGLAASFVSLIQFGGQILLTSYGFLNTVNKAPIEVSRLLSEVGSVHTLLDELNVGGTPSPWHVTWPIYGLAAPINTIYMQYPPLDYDSSASNIRTITIGLQPGFNYNISTT